MALYSAQSSRGAIFVWRQGEGGPVADTGTVAPRPKWQLRARGVRAFVYAKARGADVGGDSSVPVFVHHYQQQGIM